MSQAKNEATLQRYFGAFAARDGDGMAACYAAPARFHDPVFDLTGEAVGAMWRMLCSRAHDLRIESRNLVADAVSGSADWEARYTFSATGRLVHNVVHSSFDFLEGRIIAQTDHFDFWRWSRQALGPAGWILGWTPMLRHKMQTAARERLEAFMASGSRVR